ncbi:ornithine cyclodeaminase family protein [Candidatus Parcubacteria bacterium]|nr:MAG: ornithine cyclodeaminase family protein [Candidatus Parcubacteria bacterium]
MGHLLGAIRTAAINAVALRHMARPDATSLGILGSGFQARVHLQAAMAVKAFERVIAYSPTPAHLKAFAEAMQRAIDLPLHVASSSEEVVRRADVLICATTSRTPVFDAAWLRPGTHVNTIGPKFAQGHEVPLEAARRAEVIVTDSLAQVDAYAETFFLKSTPERERMMELSEVVVGRQAGRLSQDGLTLFCSVGLAGTEVVVADALLSMKAEGA